MMSKRAKAIWRLIFFIIIAYVFLCLCNWEYNPQHWNGFSRFFLGFVGTIGIINVLD